MGSVGVSDDDRAFRTDNVRRAVPPAPYWLSFVKFKAPEPIRPLRLQSSVALSGEGGSSLANLQPGSLNGATERRCCLVRKDRAKKPERFGPRCRDSLPVAWPPPAVHDIWWA